METFRFAIIARRLLFQVLRAAVRDGVRNGQRISHEQTRPADREVHAGASCLAPTTRDVLQAKKTQPRRTPARGRTMNPLNPNDVASQRARNWSTRLGNLAAELPT